LEQTGYRANSKTSNYKSRVYPKKITFINAQGKKIKQWNDLKQVVFLSQVYADKARHEKNRTMAKVQKYLIPPSNQTQATEYWLPPKRHSFQRRRRSH